MIIFRKIDRLRRYLARIRKSASVGFVPTMGALHEGHLALIRTAREENDLTLCSIFINPTQFNDPQDFQKYPITLDEDIQRLESAGCHLLFLPEVGEIYPQGLTAKPHYDLGHLELILEGKFRPGHFQGVCWVVDILLGITEPTRLYLGRKDYQQCMVIRRMISLREHNVETRICDTVREHDGLAMSSRNLRLSPAERKQAPAIFGVLENTQKQLGPGDLSVLRKNGLNILESKGFRPDYFEICRADTLETVEVWNGRDPLVALIAAYLGDVRLIDNMILGGKTADT